MHLSNRCSIIALQVNEVNEHKREECCGVATEKQVSSLRAPCIRSGREKMAAGDQPSEQIQRIVHKLLLLDQQTRESIIADFLKQHPQSVPDGRVLL